MSTNTINDAGLKLIEGFEGLRLTAYQDSVGVWTIGYGHTKGVTKGQTITQEQAESFLRDDLAVAENAVNTLATQHDWEFNDNEFSALVSFAFNLGAGNLTKLANYGRENIADRILLFDHAGGKKLAGLTRRRVAERELFLREG